MRITVLLLILFPFISCAQVGKPFPHLVGHKLDHQLFNIPEQVKGKHTFLGMAYSREAENAMATWYQPVYETFIFRDKGGVFETEGYDIHLFLIPMFTGSNQAAHATAFKEIQKGVDKTLWPYILTYKGEIKPYKEPLGMLQKELPYFFVLDDSGKVIYTTSGVYTDKKMEEIENLLEEKE